MLMYFSSLSSSSASSSAAIVTLLAAFWPSLEMFHMVTILLQRILGSISSTMRRIVTCLCTAASSDCSRNSGSSESSIGSSSRLMTNFSAEISQSRMAFSRSIHMGKRSSLSWMRPRKVNSSIRCRNQSWFTSIRISPSSRSRWLPWCGPCTISAAVSKSCARSVYWSSRPSMEACHCWSASILFRIIFAMSQIQATRLAGPASEVFLSSSSSSSASSMIASASSVAKSLSSRERSSPTKACSSPLWPSVRFWIFLSRSFIARTSSLTQWPRPKS
mmetsp:Transcript_7688/g.22726  ORF Transcript_7688/g.22726 Transcript_7688/m.22726 type:complete len:275 (-) Transcript_7688:1685-2509(-)